MLIKLKINLQKCFHDADYYQLAHYLLNTNFLIKFSNLTLLFSSCQRWYGMYPIGYTYILPMEYNLKNFIIDLNLLNFT